MPVNERVQEAPVGTLRAAFAGIGRFLKITDKIRNKPTAGETPAAAPVAAKETAAPEAVATKTAASEPAAAAPESTAEAVAEAAATQTAVEDAAAPAAADEPVAEAAAATSVATAGPAPESAPAAELPLANYDTLTIASVRARLRNLSLAQLGQLLEHEKSHAGRADFISAFERRIAKVESES